MSRVNVDICAFTDSRFDLAGVKLGVDRDVVMGRMTRVWWQCTYTQNYFINKDIFDILTKLPGLFEAVLEVGLLRVVRGRFYVSGTRGRIEWLGELRRNSRKGGEATKRKAKEKRELTNRPEGRPDSRPEVGPERGPPSPAPAPALNTKTNTNTKEQTAKLVLVWGESLKAKGLEKKPSWDEEPIMRLLLKYKDYERVALALTGARFEPDSATYKSTAHMTVQRLLNKPEFFESSVNRALEHKPVQRETATVEIE